MTVQTWIYAAWFRDTLAAPRDEGDEWVAVFAVSAPTADKAKEWGDHLAMARASRHREDRFVGSEVHLPSDPRYQSGTDWRSTPVVQYGSEASDEFIGW